jgi:hypothetical protein
VSFAYAPGTAGFGAAGAGSFAFEGGELFAAEGGVADADCGAVGALGGAGEAVGAMEDPPKSPLKRGTFSHGVLDDREGSEESQSLWGLKDW